MIYKCFLFVFSFLFSLGGFSQNNCPEVIPCDFPCAEYVVNQDGCPVCECSDGWTPINEDGCYDSGGTTHWPGDIFFITDCQYVTCLEVEDGWGGVLENGVWSEIIELDSCEEDENVCSNTFTINSGSYELFDDNLNLLNESETVLVPIYSSGDLPISSYQFNLIYNHEIANFSTLDLGTINSTTFSDVYSIYSANSNTADGGAFSANSLEIDDTYSILTIAYATSQIETLNDVLLYIPFSINIPGCFELVFSDGFINDNYLFPNQTNELLVSNQDLSQCAVDGVICLNCNDDNNNTICDEEEGCIDETACNYALQEDCTYPEYGYDCDGNCLADADSDGVCDEFEVGGCTDATACNYNGEATDDDNSCYNNDLGCGCDTPAAELGYDCDGNCLADTDADGICDEFEIGGCTDTEACNYDSSATDNDGSCSFNGDSCFVVVDSDCCCCGVCDCVCEQELSPPFICEGDLTGNYEAPWNIVLEGTIMDCICNTDQYLGCIDQAACNYNSAAVIDDGSCIYTDNCQDCGEGIFQSIDIPSGWSLFSTYLCPFYPNFDLLMDGLVENDNLVIVKNYLGNVYWPALGINGIGDISVGEGYQLKMNNSDMLTIEGAEIASDYPIDLPESWSMIGYLHQEPASIEEMMAPIVDNIILVKSYDGSVYWPPLGINGIGDMNPGWGYQIKTESAVTLSYPEILNGRLGFFSKDFVSIKFNKPINTGNNMTLGILEDSWVSKPQEGDEIIVFDQDGLIVGNAKYQVDSGTAVTIWGNDETTREKDGLYVGETYNIKLFRNNTSTIESITVHSWKEGSNFYTIDGISIIGSLSQNLNQEKQLVKVTDVIGRDINNNTKQSILLYIYDDGTVERKYKFK